MISWTRTVFIDCSYLTGNFWTIISKSKGLGTAVIIERPVSSITWRTRRAIKGQILTQTSYRLQLKLITEKMLVIVQGEPVGFQFWLKLSNRCAFLANWSWKAVPFSRSCDRESTIAKLQICANYSKIPKYLANTLTRNPEKPISQKRSLHDLYIKYNSASKLIHKKVKTSYTKEEDDHTMS